MPYSPPSLSETENGKKPVADFLDSLENKMAAKVIGLMEILEKKVERR